MKKRKKWPLILSVAGLIAPAVLAWAFYALVNREGAKAWAETRERLEAQGETFVLEELFPPAIPDEENFFAIPLLRGIGVVDREDFDAGDGAQKRARLEEVRYWPEDEYNSPVNRPGFPPGYAFGSGPDFGEWETYLREAGSLPVPDNETGARAVLLALDTAHGEVFEALAAGLDRPHARMVPLITDLLEEEELVYSLPLPHYSTMTQLMKTLSLRASAAVAAGDRDTARETLAILFRINEACLNEGNLIGELVAVTGLTISMNPVWESLQARVWEGEDYRWLLGELGRIDLDEAFLRAMRVELAMHLDALNFIKANRAEEDAYSLWSSGGGGGGGGGGALHGWLDGWWHLLPAGVFDQNKVTTADWMYRFLIEPMKAGGALAVIGREADLRREIAAAETDRRFYSVFARMALPVMGSITRRIVYTEAVLAQARAAAAVELYFLERGAYPRSLENLVPEFIAEVPADPVSGGAVRYLRYVEGGRCRIWCEGWDGIDDGGVRVLRPDKPERTRFHVEKYTGDWVWSYAP